jgi:DNA topoisomerase IA
MLCHYDLCHWALNQCRLYTCTQKLVLASSRVSVQCPNRYEYQRGRASRLRWAPTVANSLKDKKTIAQNLESQARYAQTLIIWTDCDREGEHIGNEIVEAARKGKPGIRVLRARFSNVERACVSLFRSYALQNLTLPGML